MEYLLFSTAAVDETTVSGAASIAIFSENDCFRFLHPVYKVVINKKEDASFQHDIECFTRVKGCEYKEVNLISPSKT
ncbi:MAG: hypothetical protein IPF67_16515 [Saprospiraceae bacterium]|nr:hypothetical protein [Candidatus Brachybacter algidus]